MTDLKDFRQSLVKDVEEYKLKMEKERRIARWYVVFNLIMFAVIVGGAYALTVS